MAEIDFSKLKDHLKTLEKGQTDPVYLVYGDEFLTQKALEDLLDFLLSKDSKRFNYEEPEGVDQNIFKLLDSMNTFSFFSGKKVVAYKAAQVFHSSSDPSIFLDKAREAFDMDKMKSSAGHILNLMGILNLGIDDISTRSSMEKYFKLESGGDNDWLSSVIDYINRNGLKVPEIKDGAVELTEAIEKGFPSSNILVITTEIVDKRRVLYKTIKSHGTIINCSVPKGNRMADKKAQTEILARNMRAILSPNGKQIENNAFIALVEMTGFDLPAFSSNLEKLVDYAGEKTTISVSDVKKALKRTKKDPVYELTGAIGDRNLGQALFYSRSLLDGGFYPLQILGAISNQIRKLLIAKAFAGSAHGKAWRPEMSFYQFKDKVISHMVSYEKDLLEIIEQWEPAPYPEKKAKSKKQSSDLFLAKNPNNPYPVYQVLLKSENFSRQELVQAINSLNEGDKSLKSSGINPKIILDSLMIKILAASPVQTPKKI